MKKGTTHLAPRKTVQIPADIRALGSSGALIGAAIRMYWDKMRADATRKDASKTV